jgi:hypothetical protein
LSLDRPKKVFFFYRQNYEKIEYPSNLSGRKIKADFKRGVCRFPVGESG